MATQRRGVVSDMDSEPPPVRVEPCDGLAIARGDDESLEKSLVVLHA